MKALFVHDHVIYEHGHRYYSPGGLKADVWKRYLTTGQIDSLTVVTRGVQLEVMREGLVASSISNVNFDPVYGVGGGLDYYLKASVIKERLRMHIAQVDVVIIRAPSAFGSYAYKICRQLKKPYITEVVGCTWDSNWNYGSILGKLRAPLSFIQNKLVIKNSIASLYVTEHFLQDRYPTNATITTHASNVHIPEPDVSVLNSHVEHLHTTDENHVFKLGILANIAVKYKGYDVAIEALKKLKVRRSDLKFQFLIAGGGSPNYVNDLIVKFDLVNEVKLLGQLSSGAEVFSYLDSLDLYLHPSKQEGLPRSVIEAMSRGCPVAASSIAGIPELLDNNFLHKPGDSDKLSFDIEKFLLDKELRVKAAKDNFEKSKEYTDEVLSQRRLEFYKKAFELVKK